MFPISLYLERINLEGHRPRMRRYAHELKKLIKIGQGEVVCSCLFFWYACMIIKAYRTCSILFGVFALEMDIKVRYYRIKNLEIKKP